ncbi:MAG: chemotaxis protein CheW, partial [Rhodospirillaceae bacterium]|nr:chemotaxis protein CheW [Rhodospirillaceae bacterium]
MKLSLLMRVGDDRYAIDLDQVVRVAPALTAAPLPFAVSALEGLAAYGRDIVPQMSLCQTVGKTDALSEGDYVVLARTASGILALRHDGFDGVRELPDGRMAPMASPVGDCRTSMIKLAGFRIYGIDARRIRIPGEASLPSVAPLAQRNDDADRHQEPISRVRQRKMLVCEDQGVQVFFDPFLVTRIASTAEGVIVVALLHEGLSANRQVERVMGMVEEDSSSRPEGGIVFAPGSADLADLEWQLADDLKSEEAAENEHESRQPVFQLSAGSTHWAVRTGDVQSIA